MSDYVVHFTCDQDAVSAYGAVLSILGAQRVEARSTFGFATNVNGLGLSQHCACFSEIPLDLLDRLVDRRSMYGVGFHQNTMIAKGGARVWYLDEGTPHRTALQEMTTHAMTGGVDPNDPIWRLTPFADNTAPNYHFEWEREWRTAGDLCFAPEEVAFLFVPERLHAQASAFMTTGGDGSGPVYACPILDPLWDDAKVQLALKGLPEAPSL